jgi:hypothetical protein
VQWQKENANADEALQELEKQGAFKKWWVGGARGLQHNTQCSFDRTLPDFLVPALNLVVAESISAS